MIPSKAAWVCGAVLLAGEASIGFTQSMVTQSDIDKMRGYFSANIDPQSSVDNQSPAPGVVFASPSYMDPVYLYHWQRDAAISMNVLRFTANSSDQFEPQFQDYVRWVTNVQNQPDPNGINVLGEPKFNIDGTVYSGGWCRPQNDGPASRATALSNYALNLISEGRSDEVVSQGIYVPQSMTKKNRYHHHRRSKNDLHKPDVIHAIKNKEEETVKELKKKSDAPKVNCDVIDSNKIDCGYSGIDQEQCEDKGCCWQPIDPNPNNYPWCFDSTTGPTPSPTAAPPPNLITTDADYVMNNWQQTSQNCDLWEEVRGPEFYTYLVQHESLLRAAEVAEYFGDTNQALQWNNTAQSICDTTYQTYGNGFISEQQRQYDCSVILGPLYGGEPECYSPTDSNVLSTAGQIRDYFAGAFAINTYDDNAGIPGTLLGRYSNDVYPGCSSNGGNQGHAWYLCSNALGDLYYRNALDLQAIANKASRSHRIISESILDEEVGYHKLYAVAANSRRDYPNASEQLHTLADEWKQNRLGKSDKLEAVKMAARLMSSGGDGQLTRVKYHAQYCDMHLSEQVCENSGDSIGAFDLTWSYGTMLSAWYYRQLAMDMGVKPWPAEKSIVESKLRSFSCEPACNGNDNTGTCCQNQCN